MARPTAKKSDPETIRDAIDDLESLLGAGVSAADAVKRAAEGNGCSEALLSRAFEARHQRPPHDWQPPVSSLEVARRVAAAKARRWAEDAREIDPLHGRARVGAARFMVPPGAVITVGGTEIAVCYLLDRGPERPHARISGVAVDLRALADLAGMRGEPDVLVRHALLFGSMILPGLDGLGLEELREEIIARTIEGQGQP
ncbi:hypothetical protein [Paracoccus sp. ME4]|uniref:hypothetical protein n=1 Tax=Paracoccus sp. ME4 TaxID=3138066 RepID=UPI00398AA92C